MMENSGSLVSVFSAGILCGVCVGWVVRGRIGKPRKISAENSNGIIKEQVQPNIMTRRGSKLGLGKFHLDFCTPPPPPDLLAKYH